MSTWLAFFSYSATRPDTWLSVGGAIITICGIVLQQHVLHDLMHRASLVGEERTAHENRHRDIREKQREANDQRKMSEIEQLLLEVRHNGDTKAVQSPARLQGLIEACSTLFGALEHEDDAAIEAFYDRQQTFITRAYEHDPLLYSELSRVYHEVNFEADRQANDALHKYAMGMAEHAILEGKIRSVVTLGAVLSAAGFVLVLLAGVLGAQIGDYFGR